METGFVDRMVKGAAFDTVAADWPAAAVVSADGFVRELTDE
jgi:hypothetical protein